MVFELKPFINKQDNPVVLSQQEFIELANQSKTTMAGAKDYLVFGKHGRLEDIIHFRKNCKEKPIITGTQIFYEEDLLRGEMIQHPDSTMLETTRKMIYVRNYDNEPADHLLGNTNGLEFLYALFDMQASPEQIKDALERLTGRDISQIVIETPAPDTRSVERNQAVCFRQDDLRNVFIIYTAKLAAKGHAYFCAKQEDTGQL